jgi:nucleoside phosphorylase
MKMGSGAMASALAAATLLSHFPCDLAVSTGPAGRLSDALEIGEWLRVSEVVAYQQGSETKVGFSLARDAVRKLDDDKLPFAPKSLADCPATQLASGELFIASTLYRTQLRSATEAGCVDMNLAGVAAACAEAGVPLLAWKVISDSADDASPTDFQAFVKSYDGEGGRRIAELIRSLPPDPNDPSSHSNLKALLESAGSKGP